MMVCDEHTPPRYLAEIYRQTFTRLHQHEPVCQYLGNQWFNVNGEMVYRAMLIDEIARLQELCQTISPQRHIITADKSIIKRLIARLRGC
jgi:hypothetical protein